MFEKPRGGAQSYTVETIMKRPLNAWGQFLKNVTFYVPFSEIGKLVAFSLNVDGVLFFHKERTKINYQL